MPKLVFSPVVSDAVWELKNWILIQDENSMFYLLSHYCERRRRRRRRKKSRDMSVDGGWRGWRVMDRRAAGTICVQLSWYDKKVCYDHVTLLASIEFFACAVLIGRDLSAQSSYVNAKWFLKSYLRWPPRSPVSAVRCSQPYVIIQQTYITCTFDQVLLRSYSSTTFSINKSCEKKAKPTMH